MTTMHTLIDSVIGGLTSKNTGVLAVAREVVSRLADDYVPELKVERRDASKHGSEVKEMRKPDVRGETIEDIRKSLEIGGAHASSAFRDWRSAVHELEARNARRAAVLIQCTADLSALNKLDYSEESEVLLRKISVWLIEKFRMHNFDFTGDLRPIAESLTRRYDLLPRAWRYV